MAWTVYFYSYTRRKSSAHGELAENPICRSIARKGLSAVGFHDLSSPKFANDELSRRSLFTQRAQHIALLTTDELDGYA
jgi:hypothetical protein